MISDHNVIMKQQIMRRTIEVVNYNPNWPGQYLEEIELIKKVFSSEIIKTHHIGSTAIPLLAAKPTIDILLEVKDIDRLDEYKKIGYAPKGEFGILGRRFYLKGEINRTHHIHAFNVNSFEVTRHLAFRDCLIANPAIANEYGQLKIESAKKCNNDIGEHIRLKSDFIKFHEQKAIKMVE